jgi:hypothetical protein
MFDIWFTSATTYEFDTTNPLKEIYRVILVSHPKNSNILGILRSFEVLNTTGRTMGRYQYQLGIVQ